MATFDALTDTWFLAVLMVGGLLCGWLARVSEGSRWQTCFQRVFFSSLAVVGMITVAALWVGPGYCLSAGTTMAVMSLVATWDFRHAHRPVG
jgi:undecaprenyl pyrophosphate phosphatase UppP